MTVAEGLAIVHAGLASAADRAGRDPSDITLVAVSKRQSVAAIEEAVAAGQRDFGENYAQELAAKAAEMPGVTWHFIGAVQGSGAAKVAAHATWVHGCVPGAALDKLARRASGEGRVLQALLQVDLAGRGTAVEPDDLDAAAATLTQMPGVELRGLMTIPPPEAAGEAARPYFQRLAILGGRLQGAFPGATELSMGMSHDYEIAVEEGATIVRVGTAVFGERPPDDPRRH